MTKLQTLLAAATADGRITDGEWEECLGPVVKALPHRASEDTRALLDVWVDPEIVLEGHTRWKLLWALQATGYPAHRHESARSPDVKAELIAANVTEVDAEFDEVVRLSGRTVGELLMGVVDSGMELSHDGLQDKLWTGPAPVAGADGTFPQVHGWDFVDGDADPSNGKPHGTSSIGVATRNGTHVKAIPARVDSWKRPENIPDAIEHAVAQGARIVTISQYTVNQSENSHESDMVQKTLAAIDRHPDVVFFYAAGNRGWSNDSEGQQLGVAALSPENFLPANVRSNLIVVAAAEDDGSPAGYSNYGIPYATFAEYADSYTLVPGNDYKDLYPGGTSLATPRAANLAAKVLLLDPGLKPAALKRLLSDSADERADWKDRATAGVLNSARAYRLAALSGLVREGLDPVAAAEKLQLTSEESEQFLRLLQRYRGLEVEAVAAPAGIAF